jgi:hypothetical protein
VLHGALAIHDQQSRAGVARLQEGHAGDAYGADHGHVRRVVGANDDSEVLAQGLSQRTQSFLHTTGGRYRETRPV